MSTGSTPFPSAFDIARPWRDLKSQLRDAGIASGGGPRALTQKDRSRFQAKLDELVQRSLRAAV